MQSSDWVLAGELWEEILLNSWDWNWKRGEFKDEERFNFPRQRQKLRELTAFLTALQLAQLLLAWNMQELSW